MARVQEEAAGEHGAVLRGHAELYLKPHLGHLPLDQLRVGHVAGMFDAIVAGNSERERPVGPVTLHRIRATLRAALNGAMRQRLVNVNVAGLVELPTADRPAVRVWAAEQLGAFLDTSADDRLSTLYT